MAQLQVLVTGTEGWAVEQAAGDLVRRGHRVVREVGDLDGSDVVVTVRAHPLPHVARPERCVTDAVAAGLPVVVAGAAAAHPFGERAVHAHHGLDGLADVVESMAVRGTCGPTVRTRA